MSCRFRIGETVICVSQQYPLALGRKYKISSIRPTYFGNPKMGEHWVVRVEGIGDIGFFESRFKSAEPEVEFIIVEFNLVTGQLKHFGPVTESDDYADKIKNPPPGKTYMVIPLSSIEEMINGNEEEVPPVQAR